MFNNWQQVTEFTSKLSDDNLYEINVKICDQYFGVGSATTRDSFFRGAKIENQSPLYFWWNEYNSHQFWNIFNFVLAEYKLKVSVQETINNLIDN